MTRRRQSEAAKHPEWSATESCAENTRRVLPGLVAEYFALGRALCGGEPSLSDLHDFRLAGKRLRYSLELFRDHYDPALTEFLADLRSVQRRLGAISDCTATVALLEEEGLANGDDGRRLIGFLMARERAHVAEFLGHWKTKFDSPGKAAAWERYLRRDAGGSAEPDQVDRKPRSA